jgi:prepilin-type N-terminal cleavage/methylation domain-containing protein
VKRVSKADTGFSLIEVVVGLAVTSAVLMGLTGVFSVVGSAKSRSEEAQVVVDALVNVKALATQLGAHKLVFGTSETDFVGFVGLFEPELRIDIGLDGEHRLRANVVREPSSLIDLSNFDSVALEVFTEIGGTYSWIALSPTHPAPPLLLRVRLAKEHRMWSVVLWGAGPLDGGG